MDPTASVGPYSIVGAKVRVGAHTAIGPHCVISGSTTIGTDNRVFAFCAIGGEPQDKKYAGEETTLVIGDRNTIRESCTINTGTVQDTASGATTRIGDDNWIMNCVHIAHDCRVGSNTIIAGYAGLAGHVQLGDWAIVGAQSGLHQFVKMGAHSMCGFQSHVSQDLPPFMMAEGNPLGVRGFNGEGLRRRGFSAERVAAVKQMHRLLYRCGLTFEEAREQIATLATTEPAALSEIATMSEFLAAASRGIAR
ncbi:MAG: acyl-ACP--UDP-N-acetylglucosamine O-acyltransferase [Pseudomonadota bacterium]|nr:acyl-ACP--UDP-N-acetylglucosamine O-acyltransferase [Pseudomonadota bacterium]